MALTRIKSPMVAPVTATGGTAARKIEDRLADRVNLLDFRSLVSGGDWQAAIQAWLDAACAAGKAAWAPAGEYVCGAQITQTGRSVDVVGDGGGTTRFRFTNPASAGFSFAPDEYLTGPPNSWDSITLRGFSVIADGVLLSPAINIAYPAVAFDGNRKVFLEDIAIRPRLFGTDRFSAGLVLSNAVGVKVEGLDYVGDNANSSPAVKMTSCFDVTVTDPNVDYASEAILALDSPAHQFEGLQIVGGTLNNVTRGVVAQKTGSTSCIFVSVLATHIAAYGSAVDLTDIDQWFVDSCLLYMAGSGSNNGATVLINGGSDTGWLTNTLLSQNTGATGVTGAKFVSTSTNIHVHGNTFASYATGIARGSLIGSSIRDNLFHLCATNLTGAVGGHERHIDKATGAETKPRQPAFLGQLMASTANNQTGDGTAAILTGMTAVYDQGGNFDGTNYTATVTGKHALNASVTLSNVGAGHTKAVLYLITSNRSYLAVANPANLAASDGTATLSLSVVADMDAGDIAQVQVSVHNSTKTVGIFGNAALFTHFSGHLSC